MTGEVKYILSADIGTTSSRCHIYNQKAELIGKAQEKMHVEYPQQGYCEIDPNKLWGSFLSVCKGAVEGN